MTDNIIDYIDAHLAHAASQPSRDAAENERQRSMRRTYSKSRKTELRAVTAADIMRLHDETMDVLDQWIYGEGK